MFIRPSSFVIYHFFLALALTLTACRSATPPSPPADSPRILYLAPDNDGQAQLFVTSLDANDKIQLTREKDGVLDFAPAPDGETIAYATRKSETGGDLWRIASDGGRRRRLLNCGKGACSQVAWITGDGAQSLIYTQRDAPDAAPKLWRLNPETGDAAPLFNDPRLSGYGARVSSNGRLAYLVPADDALRIYNFQTGDSSLVFSKMKTPPVWSFKGDSLFFNDTQMMGEAHATQILRMDLPSGKSINLSGDKEVDDAAPAPSPDGEWLAFGRKAPRAAMGRQLWLMRLDGSQARALTNDTAIHHAPLSWSADGRYLLFQRAVTGDASARPALWVYEVESESFREIASPGRQGVWLP